VSSNGINIIITSSSSSSSHMMSHADTASCDVTKTVTVLATAHIAAAAQIIQSYSSAGANMHPCILTLKV